MKKVILVIVSTLFLFSCKNQPVNELIIHPSINKTDSLLILNIKNDSDLDLMVEFPYVSNFYYKDEIDASSSELVSLHQSFAIISDYRDTSIFKNSKCKLVQQYLDLKDSIQPKFLEKRSEKKYYLKIKRYRSGKTIVFQDDNFSFVFNLLKEGDKQKISSFRNYSCNGYKYFTGTFKFFPSEITLP